MKNKLIQIYRQETRRLDLLAGHSGTWCVPSIRLPPLNCCFCRRARLPAWALQAAWRNAWWLALICKRLGWESPLPSNSSNVWVEPHYSVIIFNFWRHQAQEWRMENEKLFLTESECVWQSIQDARKKYLLQISCWEFRTVDHPAHLLL